VTRDYLDDAASSIMGAVGAVRAHWHVGTTIRSWGTGVWVSTTPSLATVNASSIGAGPTSFG